MQDPAVESSFREFGGAWVQKMRTIRATYTGASGERKRIGAEHELELRRTSSVQAPYVGVLRYCESDLRCTGAAEATCSVGKSTVVTELFRYQGGKWIY